jgi:hypothetical protein
VKNTPVIISPFTWFGVGSLKRNETAVTHRIPTTTGPFTFAATLSYSDQFGTSKSTTYALECTE